MGHRKEKDYEVAEVKNDVWSCDFCDSEFTDRDDVKVFGLNPEVRVDHDSASKKLVWTNKDEGRREMLKMAGMNYDRAGHICKGCIEENLEPDEEPSTVGRLAVALRDIIS